MPNAADQTRALLKALVEDKFKKNFSEASRFLGLDPSSGLLRKWVSGERSPTLANAAAIFERLGITLNIPDGPACEYDYIPKHTAKAGAGASLETSAETEGYYAFRKDWLSLNGIYADKAVLLEVVGDSMEPLLKEGDTLLVDKNDTEVMDGRIYVVTLGDELRVKRIQKGLNGLILCSENPRYADINVDWSDLEAFIVHGRVRWFGRML